MAVAQDRGTLRRNFQGYTTDRSDVLLAFAASAIGRLPQGYVQNEVVLGRYQERLRRGELPIAKGYGLTRDDRLRADLIERVMFDFRVDVEQVCRDHQHPESAVVEASPALERLAADGIIRGTLIEVEPEARWLVRTVASAFDDYLGASGRTHSRAV